MGRLSDIFRRRWFFIGSSILAIVGNIIGASTQSINMLIVSNPSALDLLTHYYPEFNIRTKGTNTINGLAAAGQLSFSVVMGELVSNRMRGPINAFVLSTSVPFAVFEPPIARAFYKYTALQWRWSYNFWCHCKRNRCQTLLSLLPSANLRTFLEL